MAYVVEYMTKEIEEKVLRDFAADPDSSAILESIRHVRRVGDHSQWVIDRDKDFYFFHTRDLELMHTGYMGHRTYIFFFKGKVHCLRVYSGRNEPDRAIDGKKVDLGFTCFEELSSVPSDSEMEEFSREFIEVYLVFRPIELDLIRPFFSDPLILKRRYAEKLKRDLKKRY